MRILTIEEIKEIVRQFPRARRVAVENFLATMGTDRDTALRNLELDARLYHWNRDTVRAIARGIKKACK